MNLRPRGTTRDTGLTSRVSWILDFTRNSYKCTTYLGVPFPFPGVEDNFGGRVSGQKISSRVRESNRQLPVTNEKLDE